jgi:hypothetical protein
LPYQFENVIYNLARENFQLLTDQIPAIIFLKTWQKGQRLAALKVSQILIAVPPGTIQVQQSNSLPGQIPFYTRLQRVMT